MDSATNYTVVAHVCIICPCYNEQEGIEQFYFRLNAALDRVNEGLRFKIIFVDDGSTDDTLRVLNRLAKEDDRMVVCSLSKNFGHQIALSAGLDVAEGDAVILMDSDGQHPPELIHK